MPRVLVTGAGGLVGQHLCRRLLEAGWTVRGFGRSPRPPTLEGVEWLQGDVTDAASAARAAASCEATVHLACLPLGASNQDPWQALRINTGGTLNLLQAALEGGVERVVFASSGQVYGGHGPLPNREADVPRPDSHYAASKLAGEAWCEAFRARGLSVCMLRLFNVYGPSLDGRPRNTVEVLFLQAARRGQRPIIDGNRDTGRDFIHVRDVVEAIYLALSHRDAQGPIIVGTGVCTSLAELAILAARVCHTQVEPEVGGPLGPPIRFQADTQRAQDELGFRATIDLASGLPGLAEAA
ncbi:MAG TPA: NAD(P)-dependent oxidoreductase [Chloroflexota bacterium]